MAQEKKFDYKVIQDGEKWHAEITRRVSARKTSVSKRKKGFESQEAAEQWGKEQLEVFLQNLQERNKRKAEKRVVRNQLEAQAIEKEEEYKAKRLAARLAAEEEREEDQE